MTCILLDKYIPDKYHGVSIATSFQILKNFFSVTRAGDFYTRLKIHGITPSMNYIIDLMHREVIIDTAIWDESNHVYIFPKYQHHFLIQVYDLWDYVLHFTCDNVSVINLDAKLEMSAIFLQTATRDFLLKTG